ncbi:hypothetical protein CDL26_10215 [Mediterraneibacter gnavus]|uniref:Uncharacterized protein n=2 Tax=Mediterraneibacter gnavus TaxID=33038 RepID=A0A2N5PAP8_MEDGN|nr:hypothetical protein CDL26_10215 [Mediterraneibacter gnavus]PLT72198.1 hypothetical protein CDL23_13680 [Mediterraneibacter gnavus]
MYPQQCRASTRKSQGKLERCSSREPSGFSRRLFENMRNVCMGKMDDTEKVLENNANSDINFDTSVLQEKNETYSSLTDTYGIDLFTDQYEEKIQEVHLKEYDAYQKIEKKLFETDLESVKNEYEKIQDQLFLYTSSEVKKEEIKRTDNTLGVNIAITGIMVILFFFVFFLIFDKKRRRRREDAVNNYTYEF